MSDDPRFILHPPLKFTPGNEEAEASLIARIEELERKLDEEKAENEALRSFVRNPTRHKFWGAGEAACPSDIKAPNGELHTLRCKTCGMDNPVNDWCIPRWLGRPTDNS